MCRRRIGYPPRPQAHDLTADVRVAGAAPDQGGTETEPGRPQERLAHPVQVVHGQVEDGQPRGPACTGVALDGRPLGRRSVVLDQERRQVGTEPCRHGEAPPDDPAIGTAPFAGDRLGDVRTAGAKCGDVVIDGVGGDGPRREPTAALQGPKRRCPDPRRRSEGGSNTPISSR